MDAVAHIVDTVRAPYKINYPAAEPRYRLGWRRKREPVDIDRVCPFWFREQ
jgi:hypothetical protein